MGDGRAAVAGVDEVGRGSLFGCVVAAAVILDPAYRMRGLRDSKLLLRSAREVLARAYSRTRGRMGRRSGGCRPHRSDQHLPGIAGRNAARR